MSRAWELKARKCYAGKSGGLFFYGISKKEKAVLVRLRGILNKLKLQVLGRQVAIYIINLSAKLAAIVEKSPTNLPPLVSLHAGFEISNSLRRYFLCLGRERYVSEVAFTQQEEKRKESVAFKFFPFLMERAFWSLSLACF